MRPRQRGIRIEAVGHTQCRTLALEHIVVTAFITLHALHLQIQLVDNPLCAGVGAGFQRQRQFLRVWLCDVNLVVALLQMMVIETHLAPVLRTDKLLVIHCHNGCFLVLHAVILLQVAAHITRHLERQSHVEAEQREFSPDGEPFLVAGFHLQQEVHVLTRNADVLLLVTQQVCDEGMERPVLLLQAILHLHVILLGRVAIHVCDADIQILHLLHFHTHHQERHFHHLVISGRNGHVIMSGVKYNPCWLNLEVYLVRVGAFGTGDGEFHDALLGWGIHLGGIHITRLPAIHNLAILHHQIVVPAGDLDLSGQPLVCELSAILGHPDNAGTHLLGSVTHHQRVAKVLVQVHAQVVRLLLLLLLLLAVLILLTLTLTLLLLPQPLAIGCHTTCGSTCHSTANSHCHSNRNQELHRATLFRSLVVLLMDGRSVNAITLCEHRAGTTTFTF